MSTQMSQKYKVGTILIDKKSSVTENDLYLVIAHHIGKQKGYRLFSFFNGKVFNQYDSIVDTRCVEVKAM